MTYSYDPNKPLRIAMVSPYSFEAPGGVQTHIRELTERLRDQGHDVRIVAPAPPFRSRPTPLDVHTVGRAVPFPYNGSVARITVGPAVARRTTDWLDTQHVDVVHIHEPLVPGPAFAALGHATAPIVATFHTCADHSRFVKFAARFAKNRLGRLSSSLAVSDTAAQTLHNLTSAHAPIIPNGVDVHRYAGAEPVARWSGTATRPTVGFLGRWTEPRKGLRILIDAVPKLIDAHPGVRVLVAGPGEEKIERRLLHRIGPDAAQRVTFLGQLQERDKVAFLNSIDIFVAPQTGGESFGIVLTEAMSAGATVVASDLPAFAAVLDHGRAGKLFTTGDSDGLADACAELLTNRDHANQLARSGHARVIEHYDWSVVADQLLRSYRRAIRSQLTSSPASTVLTSTEERKTMLRARW